MSKNMPSAENLTPRKFYVVLLGALFLLLFSFRAYIPSFTLILSA